MSKNPHHSICVHCGTWMPNSHIEKMHDEKLRMGICKGCASMQRSRAMHNRFSQNRNY